MLRGPRRPSIGQIALVLAALYLLVGLLWPGAAHYSPDGDAKELQVLALRWDHGLRVDYLWPGRALDPGRGTISVGWSYFGVVDGQLRFAWPPAFALLSWPFHALLGDRGLFVIPAVAGAACAYLAGKIAEQLRAGIGPLAAILTGLATPVFFYSTLFWEHTPALALGLLGTLLLVRGTGLRSLFLAGVAFAAAAGAFRSDFYVFAAALIGGAFVAWPGQRRFPNALAVGAGAIVGSLPWLLLNYAVSRHALPLNAVNNTAPPSLDYLVTANLGTIPHYLVGMTVRPGWRWGIAGGGILAVILVRVSWRRSPAIAALVLVGWAVAILLLLQELHHNGTLFLHGWLVAAPVAVFVLASPRAPSGDGLAFRILACATVLHLLADFALIIACYPNGFASDGNGEWGPRYYIGVFPLLAILATERIAALARDRRLAAGVAVVILASVGVQISGLAHVRHLTLATARLRHLLHGPDDTPLVDDGLWALPAIDHEAMFTRPSFTIPLDAGATFAALVQRMWDAGYRRIEVVSGIPWATHPFATTPLPEGLELTVIRSDETDRVQATILALRRQP